MTILGAFFVPAAIICFLWRPTYLLPLLVLASIFEAGAVFNGTIGDFEFGIQPFYLVEIFIALRLAMNMLQAGRLLPIRGNPVRTIVLLLICFWIWCFSSAFIMPRLFAGTLVSVPRNGGDAEFAPLQWTLSNLAQAGYLTLNVCAVLYALQVVQSHRQSRSLMKALNWAIFIAVFVGMAQFLVTEAGGDFPYEVFNNNSGYSQGFDEDVGTIHRFNSTFTEPSNAGSYLGAVSCGLLACLFSGKRSGGLLLGLLGAVIVLFLTTSTTGFATLGFGVVALTVYFFRHRRRTGKSHRLAWTVFFLISAIIGIILAYNPDLSDAVLVGTFAKWETTSFWVRLANDVQALRIFLDTNGVGVGLGSNRSSGLIFTLLSTVGVVGTLGLAAVFYKIIKSFPGSSSDSSLQMTFWALLSLTISEIVSVPDLNRPALWAFLMLVLAQLNVYFSPSLAKERISSEDRGTLLRPMLHGAAGAHTN